MDGLLAPALRPLRHYADFAGRSGRTELLAFYLLTWLVGTGFGLAATAAGGTAGLWVHFAFNLALFCPWVALAVRRLHDTGRSGWWVLVGAPPFAFGHWRHYAHYAGIPGPLPNWSDISVPAVAATLLALALLVLLLWQDDPEANLYGPNPRCDAPAAAPHSA